MPYSHVTRTAYGADAIAYARGHGAGHNDETVRNIFVAGVNMLPDEIVPFEQQMQPLWDKADPRHKTQVNRFIVSFATSELDPDSPEDLGKALDIGCEIAKANAPDCQSSVYVQMDGKGHKVHLHILTNDVTMTDYKGLDSKAYAHWHFKPLVDKICSRYFTLAQPELAPERINRSVRGARIANEQIRAENSREIKRAAAEGRVVDQTKIKPEKYIWQDDLRERIKRAASQATDEDSFAQQLRIVGVELVSHKAKDGTLSYLHPATKKQPAHYTYELIDVSGFAGKIPQNLKSKSFKLGADYQPEGVARLFQEQPRKARTAPASIQVQPIAAPQEAPERRNEQADIKQALDAAKRCVAPIVHQYMPDADVETEDRLFNRFVSWHRAKRGKAKEDGKQVPPIFIMDRYGKRITIFERLKEQFLEFISLVMQDDAERKRQQLRQQKKALTAELQRNSDGMRRNGHQEADVDYTGS